MRWRFWQRRNGSQKSQAAAREQEMRYEVARRMTPFYESVAPSLSDLPDDEFAARMSRAFRRRHT